MQIATEATTLLTFHPGFKVVCVVGGTNISSDKKKLDGRVDFLVATPGRLNDHLQNTTNFGDRCKTNVKVLIFDEADQLLEMGFRPEVEKILRYMPAVSARQTLLFSATVPEAVRTIADAALRPGYAFIDTVGEEEQTHLHVRQQIAICDLEAQIPAIASILAQQMAVPNFKIIVFFTTARQTGFMSEIFQKMGHNVLEIHSRKSQSQRTKTSEQFKESVNVILFSSDVSARGMDYPDVTFVLQVGLTEREQYIHRLGRTARAGKLGSGMILLCPFEEHSMLRDLSDMPLEPLDLASLSLSTFQTHCKSFICNVSRDSELRKSAEQTYAAWLGFYNSNLRKCRWDKPKLVEMANFFATTLGLLEQPTLEKKTVGKMGLKGVPGLRVK